mgnify:CR=1 FL=1
MTPTERFKKARAGCQHPEVQPCADCVVEAIAEAVAEERTRCAAIAHDVYLTAQARDFLTDIERGESRASSEIKSRIAAAIENRAE